MVAQAEIWLMETPNQKRRPVLIVSRTRRPGQLLTPILEFESVEVIPPSDPQHPID